MMMLEYNIDALRDLVEMFVDDADKFWDLYQLLNSAEQRGHAAGFAEGCKVGYHPPYEGDSGDETECQIPFCSLHA